jgi:electron transport complex protein RnfG
LTDSASGFQQEVSQVFKVKHFFQQSWLLIVVSFFFGLLIAVANAAWQDKILQNEEDKFETIARGMLAEATSFETLTEGAEIDSPKGKKIKVDIKKAINADGKCTGWAFSCEGAGFADKIKIVLTVDADFKKIMGFGVLSSNETPGFGDQIKLPYYRNQFAGAPAEELTLAKTGESEKIDSEIIAISGATVSSEAVVKIINHHVEQVKKQLQNKGLIINDK